MPARFEISDLPPRVAATQTALAGRSRLAVLRFLLDHGHSSRPNIVDATGITAGGVRSALLELEELGFITTDPPQPRRGQRVRYSVDRRKLTEGLGELYSWLLG